MSDQGRWLIEMHSSGYAVTGRCDGIAIMAEDDQRMVEVTEADSFWWDQPLAPVGWGSRAFLPAVLGALRQRQPVSVLAQFEPPT